MPLRCARDPAASSKRLPVPAKTPQLTLAGQSLPDNRHRISAGGLRPSCRFLAVA